ncbi:MAG: tetratricopeptide repeat protein [Planctomycetota bacterium]|jgi:tetratricopeptide (TPR) repeat protein
MKSQHRHELKTNELAEWLVNFPKWAKERRTTIIWLTSLTVVVAALYVYTRYQEDVVAAQKQTRLTALITRASQLRIQILKAQIQGYDISANLIRTADDLEAVSREAKNECMAALALIKRAQSLRTELHYRLGEVGEINITQQLDKAKACYNLAIVKAASSPSLMAAAKYGLGLCEEELGNFKKSEEIYNSIVEDENFSATTAVEQAKLRLKIMPDYMKKLVFAPAPKLEQAKILTPELEMGAPAEAPLLLPGGEFDINLP